MNEKTLLKNNILNDLLEFGYFSEYLPNSFNTKTLLSKFTDINKQFNGIPKIVTDSVNFSIFKNNTNRRTLSVPNILSFIACASFMHKNWYFLLSSSSSHNSESPIFKISRYSSKMYVYKNITSKPLKDSLGFQKRLLQNSFQSSVEKHIDISIGCRYKLELDISNFYGSIYTHSITWSIVGKSLTKKILVGKENKCEKYNKANNLDTLIRNMNDGESYGIITGPFVSNIVAEIIMASIDQKIIQNKVNYTRYVDDMTFYYSSKDDKDAIINIVKTLLDDYKLSLNEQKIKETTYPFNLFLDLNQIFKEAYSHGDILGVINKSLELHRQGEKGALLYAAKFIQDKSIFVNKDINLIFSSLVNMFTIEPKVGKYLIKFFDIETNKNLLLNTSKGVNPKKALNSQLEINLKNKNELEIIIFLELIKVLKLKITSSIFSMVLKSKNDLAIIIALYMYSKKDMYISDFKSEEINISISKLIDELENEDYLNNRWLLLYEIKVNNYIGDCNHLYEFITNTNENNKKIFFNLFEKLSKNKVSFYNPE